MAFMYCHGYCYCCGSVMSFNPDLVPSVPGHLTKTGTREPVCRHCIESSTEPRKKNGLPPITIHPHAYDPEEVM